MPTNVQPISIYAHTQAEIKTRKYLTFVVFNLPIIAHDIFNLHVYTHMCNRPNRHRIQAFVTSKFRNGSVQIGCSTV